MISIILLGPLATDLSFFVKIMNPGSSPLLEVRLVQIVVIIELLQCVEEKESDVLSKACDVLFKMGMSLL